jgi:hypothetical protein
MWTQCPDSCPLSVVIRTKWGQCGHYPDTMSLKVSCPCRDCSTWNNLDVHDYAF